MGWTEYDVYAVLALSIIIPAFVYLTWHYDYWHRKQISHAPTISAVFGNTLCVFKQEDTMSSLCARLYSHSAGKSMYGFYFMRTPALLVREPSLARMVLQTRASSFRAFGCPNDPLIRRSPLFTGDASWLADALNDKRLKLVLNTVARRSCSGLTDFLAGRIDEEVELTSVLSRFVGEVVTSVGLGTKKSENFGPALRRIFAPGRWNGLKQAICLFAPRWARCLLMRLVPRSTERQFRKLVEHRTKNGPAANDLLHWLMDDGCDEVMDQVFVFMLETQHFVTHATSHAAFHLSRCPEVQRKLIKEIRGVATNDAEMDYEKMEYLEQVIAETLRLNPLVGFVAKECREPVEFEGSDKQRCTLKPGDLVFVSVQGMNLDETLWTDPTSFEPKRHNQRRRAFHEGPKVAAKFCMLLTKMMLAELLLNYRLSASAKTEIPLRLSKRSYVNWPDDGLWVKLGRNRSSGRLN